MDPLQLLTPAKSKAIKAKTIKPSDEAVKSSDKATKASDKAVKSSNKATKPSKQKVQPVKSVLKTPVAPVSIFAAHQIEASCNKQAASLLFTPHKQCGSQIHFTHE
jgi:hypothetical protein